MVPDQHANFRQTIDGGQATPCSKYHSRRILQIHIHLSNGRRWQIFPTDKETYVLRSQLSSPDAYLATQDVENPRNTEGGIAVMRNVANASDEIFWKITRFPNGGYKLVNVAKGSNWQLHAEDDQNVTLTKNITGEQDNQQFDFTPVGSIKNQSFSRIKVSLASSIVTSCSHA
jgi:hypothetical protein